MRALANSESLKPRESSSTAPLRVVLVDDHPLALLGIKIALKRVIGLEVVAECDRGDQALQAVIRHKPDLMILDVCLPGLACEQVILQARLRHPALKILILSGSDEDSQLRRFANVPIDGYLLKEEAPESLCQAVRVIQQGASWFSHSVAKRLMFMNMSQPSEGFFNARENQILTLVDRGLSNQAIAQHLDLARQTVSNVLSNIYQKMGVNTRLSAMLWLHDHPEHVPFAPFQAAFG